MQKRFVPKNILGGHVGVHQLNAPTSYARTYHEVPRSRPPSPHPMIREEFLDWQISKIANFLENFWNFLRAMFAFFDVKVIYFFHLLSLDGGRGVYKRSFT